MDCGEEQSSDLHTGVDPHWRDSLPMGINNCDTYYWESISSMQHVRKRLFTASRLTHQLSRNRPSGDNRLHISPVIPISTEDKDDKVTISDKRS
jgi:hypothetical protein